MWTTRQLNYRGFPLVFLKMQSGWDFSPRLSAVYAFVSGFCSSGCDFAILSPHMYLTVQTLGVAMGFVGNYANCGLSPQIDGMPVIPKNSSRPSGRLFSYINYYLSDLMSHGKKIICNILDIQICIVAGHRKHIIIRIGIRICIWRMIYIVNEFNNCVLI